MSRAKLSELNNIILETLLDRIKTGEKVNASLLSQAISFLKIHNPNHYSELDSGEVDDPEGDKSYEEFLKDYPFNGGGKI